LIDIAKGDRAEGRGQKAEGKKVAREKGIISDYPNLILRTKAKRRDNS